jgi:hypothetical protein
MRMGMGTGIYGEMERGWGGDGDGGLGDGLGMGTISWGRDGEKIFHHVILYCEGGKEKGTYVCVKVQCCVVLRTTRLSYGNLRISMPRKI